MWPLQWAAKRLQRSLIVYNIAPLGVANTILMAQALRRQALKRAAWSFLQLLQALVLGRHLIDVLLLPEV